MTEDRFREYFADWEGPWNFPDPETTRARLEGAGFEEVETWMHREDATFGTEEELARFVRTAVLGRHLSALPEREKEPFVAAVVARISGMGSPVVDYIRLNMLAVRGSA
jgi:hypothetical protein